MNGLRRNAGKYEGDRGGEERRRVAIHCEKWKSVMGRCVGQVGVGRCCTN